MGYLSIIALIISATVLFFGLLWSSPDGNLMMFFHPISLFIVLGGTFAATSLSFRINKMYLFFVIFLKRILKDETTDYSKIIKELMKLSEANRSSNPDFEMMVERLDDFFLKDAMKTFMDQVLDKANLFKVLKSRSTNIYQHYLADANKFRAMAQFPPAFGMMGTTIGMIVLLSKLSGADAAKYIGPAMAICLITTMYGVAFANLLVIPIAENLTTAAKEQYFKNNIIVEGMRLIYEKTNPVELAEILNSYLRPADRIDWKKAVK